MSSDLTPTIQLVRDLRANLLNIGDELGQLAPDLRRQVERNFDTLGRHSGQRWSFRGEPKYRKRKRALQGTQLASRPLWTRQDELRRSYIRPSHAKHISRVIGDRMFFGSSVSYAQRLATGGTGPLGEPYPGRDPLAMTDRQLEKFQLKLAQGVLPLGFF